VDVGVIVDRHARAVDRVDVVADGVGLLADGELAGLLVDGGGGVDPARVVQRLRRVELAAVRGADDLLDLGEVIRARDHRVLVDVVVAAGVVLHAAGLQAGEEGVLHRRVRVRLADERRVLVVLGDERLV